MKKYGGQIKKAGHLAALILLAFIVVSLAGCGYSFIGRKGMKAENVSLGPIINKTTEPGLAEVLYSALSDELMKQGINVDQDSPNKISGTLTIFGLTGVAEANRVFTSYQISISGMFVFRGADGKKIVLSGSSPFIMSFSATGDLNDVFAQKQQAIKAGMQSFASQIVSGLIIGP